MKKLVLSILLSGGVLATAGAAWRNLDDAHWYSGDKLTEADLAGKVVLVDQWGLYCEPCKKLLPEMEKLWKAYKGKPFILLGSHHQQASAEDIRDNIAKKHLTYPIYSQADLVNAPKSNGLPFIYVVNHLGQVVYSGRSHRDATEAVVNALGEIGRPPSIVGGIVFDKQHPYKSLEKQLVLGKPVESIEKKLRADIEKAEKKSASQKDKDKAEEARKIVAALEAARTAIKGSIEAARTTNPEEALKLAQLYMKSFPKDGAEYKEQIPEMTQKAKEWKAEQKAKAAEAKRAKK